MYQHLYKNLSFLALFVTKITYVFSMFLEYTKLDSRNLIAIVTNEKLQKIDLDQVKSI